MEFSFSFLVLDCKGEKEKCVRLVGLQARLEPGSSDNESEEFTAYNVDTWRNAVDNAVETYRKCRQMEEGSTCRLEAYA
jgi:hypothetical protein